MWERAQGEQVDGVIATDPVALSYLLEATGPVTVPVDGGAVDLDAGNVVQTLLSDAYADLEPGEQTDTFFAAVAARVLEEFLAGGPTRPSRGTRSCAARTSTACCCGRRTRRSRSVSRARSWRATSTPPTRPRARSACSSTTAPAARWASTSAATCGSRAARARPRAAWTPSRSTSRRPPRPTPRRACPGTSPAAARRASSRASRARSSSSTRRATGRCRACAATTPRPGAARGRRGPRRAVRDGRPRARTVDDPVVHDDDAAGRGDRRRDLARRVEHAHDHPAGPAHRGGRALRLSRFGSRHGTVTNPASRRFSPWTSVQLARPRR